jgi:hypothetical protein
MFLVFAAHRLIALLHYGYETEDFLLCGSVFIGRRRKNAATKKPLPHRRRPVPMAEIDPGFRREDEEGGRGIESSECV